MHTKPQLKINNAPDMTMHTQQTQNDYNNKQDKKETTTTMVHNIQLTTNQKLKPVATKHMLENNQRTMGHTRATRIT